MAMIGEKCAVNADCSNNNCFYLLCSPRAVGFRQGYIISLIIIGAIIFIGVVAVCIQKSITKKQSERLQMLFDNEE